MLVLCSAEYSHLDSFIFCITQKLDKNEENSFNFMSNAQIEVE